jgi:deoxyribodipyrimidine photo-lyase
MRTLVWFRGKDLRVADHTPLSDAAAQGEVVPLFVLDPFFFAPAAQHHLKGRAPSASRATPGAASRSAS